jgi:predicted transcriptional regulator
MHTIKMKLTEMKSLVQAQSFCEGDVLKCILGLCDLDVSVFNALKGERCSVNELAKKVNRDRSTVQRSVKNLIATGLASRQSESAKAGRKYFYSTIEPEKLREILILKIEECCGRIKEKVNSTI